MKRKIVYRQPATPRRVIFPFMGRNRLCNVTGEATHWGKTHLRLECVHGNGRWTALEEDTLNPSPQ